MLIPDLHHNYGFHHEPILKHWLGRKDQNYRNVHHQFIRDTQVNVISTKYRQNDLFTQKITNQASLVNVSKETKWTKSIIEINYNHILRQSNTYFSSPELLLYGFIKQKPNKAFI